jgi:pimeloyl-ACP methyl ester carboxylesterase
MKAFEVHVSDEEVADLKARLAATRWPREEPENAGWDYGANMAYVKELCAYWQNSFDWRAVEAEINGFDNFTTEIDGQDIHFIVEQGSGANPVPLLLTHGWPGSILEFIKVIEPLAHPERFGGDAEDGFTVVVPSLPGYGFSGSPGKPIDCRHVAGLWRKLMVDVLEHSRFIAQGGDWGCLVTSWIAADHGDVCIGAHHNMWIMRPPMGEGHAPPDAEEQVWLDGRSSGMAKETAYQMIQATKPQSLSYGLTDSPAGLAGWITEKFHRWGDTHGEIESSFSKDRLLANIALYWFTATINTSTWMYCAIPLGQNFSPPDDRRIETPVGIAQFPGDTFQMPPRQWVERAANVVHWTTMPSGGHFAAMEEADLFVDDVRAFRRLIA